MKTIYFNLFIEINNNFNELKLNRYHHISTIISKKPQEFINEIVDDLCDKIDIKITDNIISQNHINNIDKRIDMINNKIKKGNKIKNNNNNI